MKEKDIQYIVEALRKSSPRYVRFIRLMLVRFNEEWLTEKDNKGDTSNERGK